MSGRLSGAGGRRAAFFFKEGTVFLEVFIGDLFFSIVMLQAEERQAAWIWPLFFFRLLRIFSEKHRFGDGRLLGRRGGALDDAKTPASVGFKRV